MAKIKTNKILPKKTASKNTQAKKDVKKISPSKQATAKPGAAKQNLSRKVVSKPASPEIKLTRPAVAEVPAKNGVKAAKSPGNKLPVSKENSMVAKKNTQPTVKKHNSLVKSTSGKKENNKPVLKTAETESLAKAKSIKVIAPKPVVLPKITTTKSRKYEPEFTKSVLDQAVPENNGPTMRYSDAELNEFRELIQRKLETAKKELGYLQGLITRKDDMGGDETDNRYMTMEDGSLSMEREQLSQMASRQITFIDHLEKAMMRIENKTYGICRISGKLIDKARLRAVPHATLSIEAKMGIAK